MDNGGAFTDRLLADVGITTGAAALDVGCGPGDVTLRLAELVGPAGRIVGVDTNDKALEKARDRAAAAQAANITFQCGDVYALPIKAATFDIVTCRRLLMYLPDKVPAIRCMLNALKPGGCLIIQEHDRSLSASSAPLPLNERANYLVWDTVAAEGADIAIGLKLYDILAEAGATDIQITAEAVVQTPQQAAPTGTIIGLMADRIVASGVASRTEIEALDPSTLDERLAAERQAAGACFIGETIFGVVARRRG
ncbi:MAG: methyltransferase domain-containing protein [Pseudomonadota bacterium]